MFQRTGTCYHTGYQPRFYEPEARILELPAIKKMKERILSTTEQKEKENQYYV
jgi:hypothetical protein